MHLHVRAEGQYDVRTKTALKEQKSTILTIFRTSNVPVFKSMTSKKLMVEEVKKENSAAGKEEVRKNTN